MKKAKKIAISIFTLSIALNIFSVNIAGSVLIGEGGYMQGIASWYAEFSPGIRPTTANMERFDHDQKTCAIWDIPFNTILEVTNLDNGKKVRVRVNDRGPARRLCRQGRIIDLTKGSFESIADLDEGLINVRVRVVE